MAICKFWLTNNCKNGDRCRFEHPPKNATVHQNTNRFGVLSQNSQGNNTRGRENTLPYNLDADVIKIDLSSERPIWVLSAYGPGKQAPDQLFGGSVREQSFEEMRLRFYELSAQGQQQQAIQEFQSLKSDAEHQMQNALKNISGAVQYILDGERRHPNRIDICNGATQNAPPPAQNQASSFGRSSVLGPVSPTHNNSPFGRAAIPGPQSNPFATMSNPFDRKAIKGVQSWGVGAGQTPSNQNNAFASQPTPAPINPFAKSATSAMANPFLRAASGQNTTAVPGNPFQNFGTVNTTTQPNEQSSAGSTQLTNSNPFTNAGTSQANGRFVAGAAALPSSTGTRQDSSGRLRSWNGKTVDYIDDIPCFQRQDGAWERIWFPSGPPAWRKGEVLPAGQYDETLENEYRTVKSQGSFANNLMPELPPKREWCSWEF